MENNFEYYLEMAQELQLTTEGEIANKIKKIMSFGFVDNTLDDGIGYAMAGIIYASLLAAIGIPIAVIQHNNMIDKAIVNFQKGGTNNIKVDGYEIILKLSDDAKDIIYTFSKESKKIIIIIPKNIEKTKAKEQIIKIINKITSDGTIKTTIRSTNNIQMVGKATIITNTTITNREIAGGKEE
jgi:hypothetical protein